MKNAMIAKLPAFVKIGAHDYRIETSEASDAELSCGMSFGRSSTTRQSIMIRTDISTNSFAVEIFLHECFHAIFHNYGVGLDDREERLVTTMGVAVTTLHRDNPWLHGWIAEGLGINKRGK